MRPIVAGMAGILLSLAMTAVVCADNTADAIAVIRAVQPGAADSAAARAAVQKLTAGGTQALMPLLPTGLYSTCGIGVVVATVLLLWLLPGGGRRGCFRRRFLAGLTGAPQQVAPDPIHPPLQAGHQRTA